MLAKQPNIFYKINYWALISIAFTLTFSLFLNDVLIILFALSSLFIARIEQLKTKKNLPFFILFSMLGFIQLIGMLYTTNTTDGIHHLESKITLVLLPLCLILIPALSKKQIETILKTFILSCFFCSLVSFFNAIYQNYFLNNQEIINYTNYTKIIHINPVYFAIYINFCIASIIFLMISHWKNWTTLSKISATLLIVWFSATLILLASRMSILVLFCIFSSGILYFFYNKKRIITGIIVTSTFLGLITTSLFLNPTSRARFQQLQLNEKLELGRYQKWKSAKKILLRNKNYIWGLGTGDTQDTLQAQYLQDKVYWLHEGGYNAHNEYLESTLRHGIFGLATLIACLIVPFIIGIKRKDYLLIAFITIISLSFLTESMLSRQKGVVFYAFFNALLLFHYLPSKKLSPKKNPTN